MLLAAALGLVVGPLTERVGYRRMLVASILAVACSALGMALAPGFPLLLLAGLLGAVGRAAVVPTAQAVAGAHFGDDHRRRAISWVMTGHSCSALLGLPLLTAVAAFGGWRAALLALAAVALAVALLLWRTPMADGGRAGVPLRLAGVFAAYAPILRHRPTLAVVAASFVGATGAWAAFTYLGAYLAQRHGFSTSEVGLGYLATGVGIVAGTRLVATRLGSRPRPLLALARVAGGVLTGAALLLPLPAPAALGLLVLGAMADFMSATATAVLLAAESPDARATTLTVNNAALSLGVACGGALGGLALALADYPAVGLLSLAWMLAAAALVWWSRPRGVAVPDAVPA
jgi:predicted MFS family arabinose efflux permease